ncbi:fasciclin domain-containing protein [Candidatus Dojkabacteria bacterium]|uniref:Fasciclin domain-containing protein n=1 Tax=Candidatus Dojkabacteria bacterium TaxID=2099670 RepID=A0A955LAM4_9BACT|nr:fasciclin domain-containing protein [Candidatus Dojkabacteria bacterium]
MTKEQKRLMTYIALIVFMMVVVTSIYIFSNSKPVDTDNGNSISVSDSETVSENKNDIISVLNQNGVTEFATFLENSNLAKEIMSATENVTVLAPTNSAMKELNVEDPIVLIQSHVLPIVLYSNTLTLEVPIATSFGNNVLFSVNNGELNISNGDVDSTVINADIPFENGNIFIISDLLLPN